MLCNEYRELMFERLSGELTPEQERTCSQHEQECVVCRAELADTKWIATRLRAGWPAEEPMPLSIGLPQPGAAGHASASWFDVGAMWFTRASAAVVVACLLATVVLRPTVQADRGGVRIAFGPAAVQAQPAAASSTAGAPANEVALQVRELRRNQAALSQQVQMQGLYLESLWRGAPQNVRPASFTR